MTKHIISSETATFSEWLYCLRCSDAYVLRTDMREESLASAHRKGFRQVEGGWLCPTHAAEELGKKVLKQP